MIAINLNKAKQIGHNIRRDKRDAELKPYDDIIAKRIPGTNLAAIEAARQEIRDRYAIMQTSIDQAKTPEEIKAALGVV